MNRTVPALAPRADGHQFVFYGDCCSGIPDGLFERNFASVNAAVQRLSSVPDFIVFLGDHVMGPHANRPTLAAQWDYWLHHEMDWLNTTETPIYHCTSNHNTVDATAESVWRHIFPGIPRNGAPGQEGLCYWIRRDDLLLVIVNTNFSGLGGAGHVESECLDRTLHAHRDARHKIVAGHHPLFPVNGYDERPLWCVVEDEAEAFCKVLRRHGVLAYLCSHIIAFDVQERNGVLQVCSGGAGTNHGPGGFMGDGEYHHFVQASLDTEEFRLQTIDTNGVVRETFSRSIGTV